MVAIAVGVGVTVLSAIVPARRAVRIPPSPRWSNSSRTGAVGARRAGEGRRRRRRSPASARCWRGWPGRRRAGGRWGGCPVRRRGQCSCRWSPGRSSSALGRPLSAILGTPGRLARENAMRNPRRTAQTAAALMIGLSWSRRSRVLGASLSTSAADSVDSAVNADYIVSGTGALQPVGRSCRLARAPRNDDDHRVSGAVRVPRLAVDPGRGVPRASVADAQPARRSMAAVRRRWPPASC